MRTADSTHSCVDYAVRGLYSLQYLISHECGVLGLFIHVWVLGYWVCLFTFGFATTFYLINGIGLTLSFYKVIFPGARKAYFIE